MPEKLRAKLRVNSVSKIDGGFETAKLFAVYGVGNENAAFAKATPSASLEINISQPDAFGFFKPGGEYYVDFTPAPKP